MSVALSPAPEQLTEQFFALRTPRDVARLLDVDYGRLVYHLYRFPDDEKYIIFRVPKRSGGTRRISAPATALKIIQQKLNQVLQSVYEPKASVHGFVRGKSVVTNASKHVRKNYVLNLDLKDFFPSINFGRVRGIFMAVPYELQADVATVLAQICCFDNQLPQGAPTSPVVSNMICARMDAQLRRLAQKWSSYYTRYADDMTFSTRMRSFPSALASIDSNGDVRAGRELAEAIEGNGFRINPNKVRLRTRYRRQEVTGLTVNKKPNVDRRYVRRVRAMLHAWKKYGLQAAENEFLTLHDVKHRNPQKAPPAFASVVRGRIEFLGMVRGRDDVIYQRLFHEFRALAPELVTAATNGADTVVQVRSEPMPHTPAEGGDRAIEDAEWDVFISHAGEDKETVARPLATALSQRGLRVWYDEFALRLGDSLRRSIDHGLSRSRYGVVILSPSFFEKEWPQKELDALANLEVDGEKRILPVWHGLGRDEVAKHSPMLSDRVAVSTARGMETLITEILRVVSPEPPAVPGQI